MPRKSKYVPKGKRKRYAKWTRKELGMLGKKPDRTIAEIMGMPLLYIVQKRYRLGIPRFGGPQHQEWPAEANDYLGTMTDQELADLFGVERSTVTKRRNRAGIDSFRG